MQVFVEAICKMLGYMLQSKNKDHHSPIEAGAGTELGNKDIKFLVMKLLQNS